MRRVRTRARDEGLAIVVRRLLRAGVSVRYLRRNVIMLWGGVQKTDGKYIVVAASIGERLKLIAGLKASGINSCVARCSSARGW